jgi:hypothetical protein
LADLQWAALCFGDGRFDPDRGQAIHPARLSPAETVMPWRTISSATKPP